MIVLNHYFCRACEQDFSERGEPWDLSECAFCRASDIEPDNWEEVERERN